MLQITQDYTWRIKNRTKKTSGKANIIRYKAYKMFEKNL